MRTFIFIVCCLVTQLALAQINNSSIVGKLTDYGSGDPVSHAYLYLLKDDMLLTQCRTDSRGNYAFRNIEKGNYTIVVNHTNYATLKIKDVQLDADLLEFNPYFESENYEQDSIELSYSDLVEKENEPSSFGLFGKKKKKKN